MEKEQDYESYKKEQDFKKYQQIQIEKFKKAFKDMIASSNLAYDKNADKDKKKRNQKYTKEEVTDIVENGTCNERAALSEYFFIKSGIYKRIVLHYATFLTYSWVLVPYTKSKFKKVNINERKVAQTYYDAADFCSDFYIENKCAIFAKEVLVKGAYYGLIQENNNKVVIQDLPFEYCRSRFKNIDDVDMVEFNMAFFDTIRDEKIRQDILETYPKVVQNGYKKYKLHKGEKWIFLPPKMGIYFAYFEERPLFLDLLPFLTDLDDYIDIDKSRNLQALKRILVQQIPIDGTTLVFEPDEAEEMHEGTLGMLQNNLDTDVITTYGTVNLLDMSSNDDQKTEIDDFQNLIYSFAGLSKELFFATTEAGLNYSICNDLAMMMILGHKFAHFFTTLLNYKFETKKVKFKLLILPISHYNSADYTSRAKELAAFGYSFLTPVLSTGLDQTNLAALKELENDLLDLDMILKPLQSSYTQSGKAQGEPIGQVSKEDSTQSDSGEQSKEEDKEKEEETETKEKESESEKNE